MGLFDGKLKVSRGRWGIDIDPNYAAIFEGVLEESAPETIRALNDAVDLVYREAFREWPVGRHRAAYKRGERKTHSKYQLQKVILIAPDMTEITGIVRNLAGWSWAIRWGAESAGLGRRVGAKVGKDLILSWGKKLAPAIGETIAREIAQARKR